MDIGIASVGWCVLGEHHIVDLGVRAFDKAETEKGDSLNATRRAWRLLKLARLFKREGLIQDSQLFQHQKPITKSLYCSFPG